MSRGFVCLFVCCWLLLRVLFTLKFWREIYLIYEKKLEFFQGKFYWFWRYFLICKIYFWEIYRFTRNFEKMFWKIFFERFFLRNFFWEIFFEKFYWFMWYFVFVVWFHWTACARQRRLIFPSRMRFKESFPNVPFFIIVFFASVFFYRKYSTWPALVKFFSVFRTFLCHWRALYRNVQSLWLIFDIIQAGWFFLLSYHFFFQISILYWRFIDFK